MNTADQARPPKMSLFPKVALWILDIFCLLLTVGGIYFAGDDLLHPSARNLESAIGTLILQLLFVLFFWLSHLLIRRTLSGNPFDKRNTRIIYFLAAMVLGLATFNGLSIDTEVISHTLTTTKRDDNGKIISQKLEKSVEPRHWKMKYDQKYTGFADFFARSGVTYGLILLGFGAIFQRGVELREEEERLRAEQALTV